MTITCAPSAFAIESAAVATPPADPPDQNPLALLQARARHEHPVRGLEHERERCRLLERQVAGDRVEVVARDRDQLGVRPVHRLADDVHLPAGHDPGVDHDALVGARDHAGAVGAEDARLGHGGQALADPDVEVVQRRGAQLDERFALARDGIGDVLVAQDLGAAVLMDPNCLHEGTILA